MVSGTIRFQVSGVRCQVSGTKGIEHGDDDQICNSGLMLLRFSLSAMLHAVYVEQVTSNQETDT